MRVRTVRQHWGEWMGRSLVSWCGFDSGGRSSVRRSPGKIAATNDSESRSTSGAVVARR